MPDAPRYTVAQFDAAAERLLGASEYAYLMEQRFNRAQLCERIAKHHFLGRLTDPREDDLALVRWVATNLWVGDGDSGLWLA